jgi:putative flavoprotein involved in K+ transport
MRRTDVVIIGGGQAGLAMSACLGRFGLEHVVLERGRVAQRWRTERWPSLRLLTPNWMTRLPGGGYFGADPDGFMTRDETIAFLADYAAAIAAPVEQETSVLSVESGSPRAFRVLTDRGSFSCRAVVVATGQTDLPFVPATARRLAPRYMQVVPTRYNGARDLPSGGVLVVGASSTGVQLAEEIQNSGRQVTLAVGDHAWLPRRYRGHDIMWWLDRLNLFDKRAKDATELAAARRQPSTQLVGSAEHRDIGLGTLASMGVHIVGRLAALDGDRAFLRRDLGASIEAADARTRRLLAGINAVAGGDTPPERTPWRPTTPEPSRIDLRQSGIRTVLWATGYRRDYSWLRVPTLDANGELDHHGGVCRVPGLYALGFNFLRRRSSHFIDGVGRDAEALSLHIAAHLGAVAHSQAA